MPEPATTFSVSSWSLRTSSIAVPRTVKARVHPLVSFRPSSEFLTAPTGSPFWRASSMGFVSPSRHQRAESTFRRAFPCSPMFRPQCFPHSRRLSPPTCLVGLFHPTAAYGIRSSGVFPATELSRLIIRSSPRAVFPALPQALAHLSSVTGIGLRVFHPAATRCG